jgi:hypothetical protein
MRSEIKNLADKFEILSQPWPETNNKEFWTFFIRSIFALHKYLFRTDPLALRLLLLFYFWEEFFYLSRGPAYNKHVTRTSGFCVIDIFNYYL